MPLPRSCLLTRCRSFVFTLEEFDRELITLIQAMVDVSFAILRWRHKG